MATDTTYMVRANIYSPASSTTLPVLQISTGLVAASILRVEITQEDSVTSAVTAFELVRSTTTAPGTLTTFTPIILNPRDPAALATAQIAGFSGTVTGTQSVLYRVGFNIISGYLYLPVPEERIVVSASSRFWIRLPVTVPAATYNILCVFDELG